VTAASEARLIHARDLHATRGRGAATTAAIRGVDLDVHAGELVLIMGPSGSGKTTLLSIVAGLLRPSSGEVEVCGERLGALDESALAALRRRRVGFIFQTHNLLPGLDALSNVALAFRMRGLPRSQARACAREALGEVGLARRLHNLPRALSTGEQQRVAIARALAGPPLLVLGDEITASLDGQRAFEVVELLRGRIGRSSAAVLVTHDVRLIPLADRVVHLEDGRIVNRRMEESVMS
jgi:putative ABC transport system ATP-binding protein